MHAHTYSVLEWHTYVCTYTYCMYIYVLLVVGTHIHDIVVFTDIVMCPVVTVGHTCSLGDCPHTVFHELVVSMWSLALGQFPGSFTRAQIPHAHTLTCTLTHTHTHHTKTHTFCELAHTYAHTHTQTQFLCELAHMCTHTQTQTHLHTHTHTSTLTNTHTHIGTIQHKYSSVYDPFLSFTPSRHIQRGPAICLRGDGAPGAASLLEGGRRQNIPGGPRLPGQRQKKTDKVSCVETRTCSHRIMFTVGLPMATSRCVWVLCGVLLCPKGGMHTVPIIGNTVRLLFVLMLAYLTDIHVHSQLYRWHRSYIRHGLHGGHWPSTLLTYRCKVLCFMLLWRFQCIELKIFPDTQQTLWAGVTISYTIWLCTHTWNLIVQLTHCGFSTWNKIVTSWKWPG